jgi:hypothetical protein
MRPDQARPTQRHENSHELASCVIGTPREYYIVDRRWQTPAEREISFLKEEVARSRAFLDCQHLPSYTFPRPRTRPPTATPARTPTGLVPLTSIPDPLERWNSSSITRAALLTLHSCNLRRRLPISRFRPCSSSPETLSALGIKDGRVGS